MAAFIFYAMKNTTLLFLTALLIISCTSEPKEKTYITYIKNESGHSVKIDSYNNKKLVLSYLLNNNDSSTKCEVVLESFTGLSCEKDSISFKFDNGKGYLCDSRLNPEVDTLCFKNKNPLIGSKSYFRDLGNNTFEFVITEEDYNNAFKLPE